MLYLNCMTVQRCKLNIVQNISLGAFYIHARFCKQHSDQTQNTLNELILDRFTWPRVANESSTCFNMIEVFLLFCLLYATQVFISYVTCLRKIKINLKGKTGSGLEETFQRINLYLMPMSRHVIRRK